VSVINQKARFLLILGSPVGSWGVYNELAEVQQDISHAITNGLAKLDDCKCFVVTGEIDFVPRPIVEPVLPRPALEAPEPEETTEYDDASPTDT
jgi:hypothetical protein